ncbi:MAG: hypothetical protein ABSG57_03845 [Candidatus Bathyarchaeia archaeon]
MISLNIAYALGIIIIILFGAVVYLSVSIVSINNNGAYFDSYVLQHGYSNADYDALQNQVNDLNATANLTKSTGWFNNLTISNVAGDVVNLTPPTSVPYAGYVAVQVNSLTGNNNTAVEMIFSSAIFSSGTYNSDVRQPVGVGGTVIFTILPTTNLVIKIGTLDGSAATETVTIVYYY